MHETAATARRCGASVTINYNLPYVGVVTTDGQEYFFQEHEAEKLLADAGYFTKPDPEDVIVWMSQGW